MITRRLILASPAILLADCGGGNSRPPSGGNAQPPLSLSAWTILFSHPHVPTSIPLHASVAFPGDSLNARGIHYVVKQPARSLHDGDVISLAFTIAGDGELFPLGDPSGAPPRVRLFLWQRGDNMSGQGAFAFFRWWSANSVVNERAGHYSLDERLGAGPWTSVFGAANNASAAAAHGFAGALANLYGVGFTLGGMFAGHGQDVRHGNASLAVQSFSA